MVHLNVKIRLPELKRHVFSVFELFRIKSTSAVETTLGIGDIRCSHRYIST